MAILFALVFASCKKDGPTITATAGTTPGFAIDSSSLHYSVDDTARHAITFSWTSSDFGAQVATNFDLLLSTDSTFTTNVSDQNFIGNIFGVTYTVAQFNSLVLAAGGKPKQADTIYARLKCSIAVQNSAPNNTYQYSQTYMITVDTAYSLEEPFVLVPGDYQGWSPDSTALPFCARLYSPSFNSQYMGYVLIATTSGDSGQFKIAPEPNWNVSYGSGDGNILSSGQSGTLSTSGGNLQISSPGCWQISCDLNALTWSATLTTWAICGQVEGNNWDNTNPIPFSFDMNNQVLVDTLTCEAGDQFKFIVNNSWTVNLGGDLDPTTGNVSNLVQDGDNITVQTAGNYIVTLNLHQPDKPVCTVVPE